MVALALLMMLAVFAALFLTSSRFDREGAAAGTDLVRMDLYAEGLAQYAQLCLVSGLWGFDEKPLNNDDRYPYNPTAPLTFDPTYVPGVKVAQNFLPGPDNAFDYYGGMVILRDWDTSMNNPFPPPQPQKARMSGLGTTAAQVPDEAIYYPNFWLTDPRIQYCMDPLYTRDAGAQDPLPTTKALMYLHPAFAPAGVPVAAGAPEGLDSLPPFSFDPSTLTAAQQAQFWWRWADLDGDGRADTPWLFYRPIGNGLYIRAAVRVEDTSSRLNVNVADTPLFVDGDTNTGNADLYEHPGGLSAANPQYPWQPYLTQAETLLRRSIYPGYPWLGAELDAAGKAYADAKDSRFPVLVDGTAPGTSDTKGIFEDQVGRFLSEFRLVDAVDEYLGAAPGGIGVNSLGYHPAVFLGDGASKPTGTTTTSWPGRYGLPNLLGYVPIADKPYQKGSPAPQALSLLGDATNDDPGRLGRASSRSCRHWSHPIRLGTPVLMGRQRRTFTRRPGGPTTPTAWPAGSRVPAVPLAPQWAPSPSRMTRIAPSAPTRPSA